MRLSLGKTQEDFGRMFGISRRKVIDLEAGKANPELRTLARIGKPFGLTVGFVPELAMWETMPGKFELYKDKRGEFRFRLKAGNGQTILASEGYNQRQSAQNGIESVQKNALDDTKYKRKEKKSGNQMFNLIDSNGQVIGTSDTYNSSDARDNGVASVKKSAPGAKILDLTST
jgi:hypothetical protein